MNEDYKDREELLQKRLERIKELEQEISRREKAINQKENARKQVLLRLAPSLYEEVAAWAEEDFRSVNGQIEFILSEAVRKRKNGK